jgi:two-component system, OmpR family, response regulator
MTRVLLAEDDTSISEPLSRALRREGYQVEVTEDGPATLGRALSDGIDLILLDIGLPELDGLEVCRRVRAEGHAVPVLILTARADEVDTVVGLDAGADDYLTKPFAFAELSARVRALLRRGNPERPSVLAVGDLHLDPAAHRVTRAGTEIDLTAKEFALLELLMRHCGQVLSRDRILEHVWDFAYVAGSNVVDQYVGYLRRKLDRPFGRDDIETVRGAGYRLRPASTEAAGIALDVAR